MNYYKLEIINYETSTFSSLDVTYVIHLENNGRLENVKKQLDEFKPSKKCIILHNKGYKNNMKPFLKKQDSSHDLAHANIFIMNDVIKNNYNNIMVLEDDFIFNKNIKSHSKNIDSFVLSKNRDKLVYFIGYIPIVVAPYNNYNYKVLFGLCTHCVIYNQNTCKDIIKKKDLHKDIDIYYLKYNCFMYYKPLCYQLFTRTENSERWIFRDFALGIYKLLQLNKVPQPGYNIIYNTSKIFSFLLLFLLFILILFIFKAYSI